MESAQSSPWRDYFCKWPENLSRSGIATMAFGEQIPFSGFLASDSMLLLDRRTPDSQGARKVVVAYDQVVALKITEVTKLKMFQEAGFHGPPPKKEKTGRR